MRVWIGAWGFDDSTPEIVRDGKRTPLTRLEHGLLAYLAARPGTAVSRRDLLVDVWHYDPKVRTNAVANTVARLRAKLGDDGARIATVVGHGYRLDLDPDESDLLGRADAIARVRSMLRTEGWCVLFGMGGIGKTRVARAVVKRGTESSWIDSGSMTSVDEIVSAMARLLGMTPDRADVDSIALGLGAADLGTVVIDACENVPSELYACVKRWSDTSEVRFLLTSRVAHPPPDDLGYVPALLLPFLDRTAAGALLRRRSQDTALDDEALDDLVAKLGGLPLAIELVAPLTRVLGVRRLADALEHGSLPSDHTRRLEAVLDSSFRSLTGVEREVFFAAACLPPGFSLDHLDSMVEGSVVVPLDGLVRRALLWREGPRFTMLEVVRQWLVPRIPEATRQRFVALAVSLGERTWRGTSSTDDRGDFWERRAICWSALRHTDDPLERAHLALAVDRIVRHIGPLGQADAILEPMDLDDLPSEPAAAVARCRALRAFSRGGPLPQLEAARQALDRARACGRPELIVEAWRLLVEVRLMLEGPSEAMIEVEELATYVEGSLGLPSRLRALVFDARAQVRNVSGEPEHASHDALLALELLGPEDAEPRTKVLNTLFSALLASNRAEDALPLLDEELELAEQEPGALSAMRLRVWRGIILHHVGDSEGAHLVLARAVDEAEESGGLIERYLANANLASVVDDTLTAERLFARSIILARRLGRVDMVGEQEFHLAQVRHKRGELERAVAGYRAALEAIGGNRRIGPLVQVLLGLALFSRGEAEEGSKQLADVPSSTPVNDRALEVARSLVRPDAYPDGLAEHPADGAFDVVFVRHVGKWLPEPGKD